MPRFACCLLRMCVALAPLVGVVAPSAAAAPALPGVPTDASLLFALESRAGALVPDADAGKGRYTLTLNGVDRRATWFTDRPQRNAGRVNARKLFRAWRELGFRATPPNAALVVDRAKSSRDTVAVELKLRSYDKRRRSVRLAVRTLGSLGGGLRHINRHLDRRLPRRFGDASLFVDNAGSSSFGGCTLGQPQLLALDQDLAASQGGVAGMLPADGRTLPIAENASLFSVLGFKFGGDGSTTFALPDMDAPAAQTAWFICAGPGSHFPSGGDLGPCIPGEVDFWIVPEAMSDSDWLPADGRTVSASQYEQYAIVVGSWQNTLQLPNVPAPEGMQSLACVGGGADGYAQSSLGQADMFTGPPFLQADWWMTARGQQLPAAANYPLYQLLVGSDPNSPPTFTLPKLTAPAAGVEYYVATNGAWPLGPGW